jgi:hypothetical protein
MMRTANYFFLGLLSLALLFSSCEKEEDNDDGIYYPTDGLVSFFKFENNLKDELSNTNDGVNSNSSPFIEGVDGKAISFNGTDQKVVFDRKSYREGDSFSISFWFKKVDTTGVSYAVECSDFIFATNNDDAVLSISVIATPFGTARGKYIYDKWTHFAGTYDGIDIKAYINGELKETTNYPGNINDSNRDLALGFRAATSAYWAGSLDELFIYNRALTPVEVSKLYNM